MPLAATFNVCMRQFVCMCDDGTHTAHGVCVFNCLNRFEIKGEEKNIPKKVCVSRDILWINEYFYKLQINILSDRSCNLVLKFNRFILSFR